MRDLWFGLLLLMAPAGCARDGLAVDAGGADLASIPDLSGAGDLTAAPRDLIVAGTDAGLAPCAPVYSSDLAGVSLRLGATRCTFTLAEALAGISLPYDVVIATPVMGVIALPQDGGSCGRPGPSGLILFERLSGGGQSYCLCDEGRCLPPSETAMMLPSGTFAASFQWDGRSWSGPSDTGNPKGAPFPVGTYTLDVSAVGKREVGPGTLPFTVRMQVPVTLVP